MNNEDMKEVRVGKLKAAQQVRKEDAKNRVHEAIERLEKINAKINFHNVAREAGVSVSYLYKYPELKQRIGELRSKQSALPTSPMSKPNSTSHGKVVAHLQERLQRLEDENKELKRKNEALAGQVYRVHHLQEQVDRLQKENERLREKINLEEITLKVTPINRKKQIPLEAIPIMSDDNLTLSFNFEDELKLLGITLNPTLSKTIKQAEEEQVLEAIEALKEQLAQGKVSNPEGWLNKAIREGWTKSEEVIVTSNKPEHQVVTAPSTSDKKFISADKLKNLSNIFKQK